MQLVVVIWKSTSGQEHIVSLFLFLSNIKVPFQSVDLSLTFLLATHILHSGRE